MDRANRSLLPEVLLLASLFSFTWRPAYCSESANQEVTPLKRFKTLLEAPPVVARLVFSETLPKDPTKAVPLDTGLADSTNRIFYELRWQPNAMFCRQIRRPDDITNQAIVGACFSVWEDKLYFLSAGGNPMLYVLEKEKAKRGDYPAPYHASLIRRCRAAEPLNLGISHLQPGMIRWEGNQFKVVTTADKKAMYIRGDVSGFSNNIPCELTVQYSNDMGVANYRIEYHYDTYAPPYYPSRITSYFRYHGKEICYRACQLLSIQTAPKALPESSFDPSPYILASRRALLYLTNDSIYFKLPSGKLIESPSSVPKLKLSSVDYRKNIGYYLAAATVTLLFLGLTAREWIHQHQINRIKKGPSCESH